MVVRPRARAAAAEAQPQREKQRQAWPPGRRAAGSPSNVEAEAEAAAARNEGRETVRGVVGSSSLRRRVLLRGQGRAGQGRGRQTREAGGTARQASPRAVRCVGLWGGGACGGRGAVRAIPRASRTRASEALARPLGSGATRKGRETRAARADRRRVPPAASESQPVRTSPRARVNKRGVVVPPCRPVVGSFGTLRWRRAPDVSRQARGPGLSPFRRRAGAPRAVRHTAGRGSHGPRPARTAPHRRGEAHPRVRRKKACAVRVTHVATSCTHRLARRRRPHWRALQSGKPYLS